jgi:hypothetical protein
MLYREKNARRILMLSYSGYSELGDLEFVEITLLRNVGDSSQSIHHSIREK